MRVAKRIAPGMDAKAMTREMRERLTDELDYEHEAQQHRAFARMWRSHPFIYVPPVVTELSSEHVLVSEWVDGKGFEDVKQMDRGTRDRFGEIVFRFFFGSLYRNGHFSGDPHPGNYRLMDDGRVAFIDFGMTKRVAREDLEAETAAVRFGMDGDVEALHRQLGAMGFYDPADTEVTPRAVFDHFHDVTRWYIEDREVTVDRDLVSRVLIDFGDPRSRHWQLMRRETMPPQAMLARRMEALTLGVLGQLQATANWHRIAREWLFGDTPSTELGEAEHPFHDRAAA
jgi:predicted unusual protein kinase regulating ubiquinone biosynthesis (AarF/ABC1/UbiB family)